MAQTNPHPQTPRPDHIKFRMGIEQGFMPGAIASQRRINTHEGNMFPAFNSLDLFDVQAAREFLAEPLQAVGLNETQRERLLVVFLGFALLTVEADRENR